MAHTNKPHIVHVNGIKNAIIHIYGVGQNKTSKPEGKKMYYIITTQHASPKKGGIPVHLCGLLQEPAVGGKITQAAT